MDPNQTPAASQPPQPPEVPQNTPVAAPPPSQQKSPVSTSSLFLKIFLALIIVLLVGNGIYIFAVKNGKPFTAKTVQVSSAPTLAPATNQKQIADTCTANKATILAVVTNFETLQKNKDAKSILTLFTPAISDTDKSTYTFLSGSDAAGPRLYSNGQTNFTLDSYSVTSGPQLKASTCIVNVNEIRSYNQELVGGSGPPITTQVRFNLVQQDGNWMIDTYMLGSNNAKYGGWASTASGTTSLAPADAQTPASGICEGPLQESIVTITLNRDTSSPRCMKVSANQQLQVINNTSQPTTITLGQISQYIAPNQPQEIGQIFGLYLAPGVHFMKSTAYGGGTAAEIWLQ